jgi:hypothetical protein
MERSKCQKCGSNQLFAHFDVLPKVDGETEDYVPRLVICDQCRHVHRDVLNPEFDELFNRLAVLFGDN